MAQGSVLASGSPHATRPLPGSKGGGAGTASFPGSPLHTQVGPLGARPPSPGPQPRARGTGGWQRLLRTGCVIPCLVSRRGAGWRGSEGSAVGYRGVTCPRQGEGRGGEHAPSTLLPPGQHKRPALVPAHRLGPPSAPATLHLEPPGAAASAFKQVPSVFKKKKKKNTQNPVP